MTARSLSPKPLQWRSSHPFASSGKVTPLLREQRSKTSLALAHHWRTPSPSFAFKANTSAMFSPISSVRSFSGHRRSSSLKITSSPPSFWYSSGFRCSMTSNARPCKRVNTKLPLDSLVNLSMTLILFCVHCFHLRYSR